MRTARVRTVRVAVAVVAVGALGTAVSLAVASSPGHARSPGRKPGTATTAPARAAPHSTVASATSPAPTTTGPIPTTTAPAGGVATPTYAVADQTFTLVDPTRPTPARGSVPVSAGRVLRTVVRRPAGLAGPLPLVVFAHGYATDPETYEPLLDAWAAAGYLVVAPDCPGSASDGPGTPVQDYAAQARDLSFVISAILNGNAGPVQADQVEPGQIVVAGHSDGGTAVTIMALNPAYADPRVKAYVNMAGQIPTDVPGPWASSPVSGALLVAVGDRDQYGNLALSTAMFAAARMPKALLVVPGGDHLGTFVASSAVAAQVRAATVRFLGAVFASSTRSFTPSQLGQAVRGTGPSPPFTVTTAD